LTTGFFTAFAGGFFAAFFAAMMVEVGVGSTKQGVFCRATRRGSLTVYGSSCKGKNGIIPK
jgi:hypothetical protein